MTEFWHAIEASDAVRRLGWGLLHSIWLGAAVAGLLAAAANRVMRRRSAAARYTTACVALVAVVGVSASAYFFVPVRPRSATTGAEPQAVGRNTAAAPQARPPIADVSRGAMATPSIPGSISTAAPAEGGATRTAPIAPPPTPLHRPPFRAVIFPDIEPALPWLAAAWAAGVVALALWQCGGWAAARRIRTRAVRPDSGLPAETVERLAQAMNVRGRVDVLESALVSVPTLIGGLGPAILLPVGLASGLTVAQLRAILAHELAHVRRHDYLANVLQSLAETLLFYHPAVWYTSRRIRAEREHCCDDLVVAQGTEPSEYAESLLCVARRALVHVHETFCASEADWTGAAFRVPRCHTT